MTTAPMPEPVTCWLDKTDFINKPCVTTTQAEAYAAAKVREALEEALEIADKYNEFATYDAIKALIPGPVEPKQEAS